MNCYHSGILGLAFLGGAVSTLSVTEEQHNVLRNVLPDNLDKIYEQIIIERRNHYVFGLVLGGILAFLVIKNVKTVNRFHRISLFVAITLMTSVVFYLLMPKSDYMLNHLQNAEQVRGMRTVSGGDYMVAVCGPYVYVMGSDFTPTIVGQLNTSTGQVGITDNGQNVYIVDGSYRYTWRISNPNSAVFEGTISGTTLTIGGTVTGTVALGQYITGTSVTAGTYITAFGSGSGGSGTYTVSKSQTVTATTIYSIIPTIATVGGISGTGPWTATVTLSGPSSWTTNNISLNSTVSASSGTISTSGGTTAGSLYGGSPTSVLVTGVTSNTFTYTVTGGSTPVAGAITNITAINPSNAGSFITSSYRSGKYVVQVNQIGATSSRTQVSELLATHDCPYSEFVVSSASTGTTINTNNTQGLYVGMTIAIETNAASDTINSSATGVTVITAITTDTSLTVTNTVSLSANTILKAYVYSPSYSQSITLTNNSATFTVPAKGSGGVSGIFPACAQFDLQLAAGDYIQIMWCTPSTAVSLTYAAAGTSPTRPARPSATITVKRFK